MNKKEWIIKYSGIDEKEPPEVQDALIEKTTSGQLAQLAYHFYAAIYLIMESTLSKIYPFSRLESRDKFKDAGS